jgi:hypothetical protein
MIEGEQNTPFGKEILHSGYDNITNKRNLETILYIIL